MLHKIDHSAFLDHGALKILYPGLALNARDSGIAGIGRIDHAFFPGSTTIKMHPHRNDEILSYFRSGSAEHLDSAGFRATVGSKKLMLMQAGEIFYHEETVSAPAGQTFEGLQIFIRPAQKDQTPAVQFHDLAQEHSHNQWRLLAAPEKAPLQLSGRTWIWDVLLERGHSLALPEDAPHGAFCLLYVYQGEISAGGIALHKQQALIIDNENPVITTSGAAELVLFASDPHSEHYAHGMFSGNQIRAAQPA